MKIVHLNIPGQDGSKPKKRVPLWKDKEAIAAGVRALIKENNAKVLARRNQQQ